MSEENEKSWRFLLGLFLVLLTLWLQSCICFEQSAPTLFSPRSCYFFNAFNAKICIFFLQAHKYYFVAETPPFAHPEALSHLGGTRAGCAAGHTADSLAWRALRWSPAQGQGGPWDIQLLSTASLSSFHLLLGSKRGTSRKGKGTTSCLLLPGTELRALQLPGVVRIK